MGFKNINAKIKWLLLYFPFCCQASQVQVTNQRLFDTIPFIAHHYAMKVEEFGKEAVQTGKVIFLGNSITEGGPWAELTGNPDILNRGIGGDITFGALQRLDDIIIRKPARLFIMIGINDIGKDIPDAVIADNVRQIIEKVQAGSAGTIVYLQSILPLNPSVINFPQHYDKEEHVISTNILLREVARKTGCSFLNLFPLFADDQQRLDKDLTADGLHLNRKGYERWVKFLQESGAL